MTTEATIRKYQAIARGEAEKRLGERVAYQGHHATIDRISVEGIHYHVTFDDPNATDLSWFWGHELERIE